MKTINTSNNEDTLKLTQTKANKKSTKSRNKNNKFDLSNATCSGKNGTSSGAASGNINSALVCSIGQNNSPLAGIVTPTTPTTPLWTVSSQTMFDVNHVNSGNSGGSSGNSDAAGTSRSHHKSYAGLEPRSIKVIWEQHDQSDIELSNEVCSRVAEDASYKLWELINNIKTYARHSGGIISYDLVNEVLKDSDVSPCLGAIDTDWDRIDYDGSYFFHSDKILELRDEYQKEITFNITQKPDLKCSSLVEDKHLGNLKKYIPSLLHVTLNGDPQDLDFVLGEAAFSPIMGSCFRLILSKIIQIAAFKQSHDISQRCWRLLKALSTNPQCRDIDCREEFFHLAEILICQLLAPYESIKVQNSFRNYERAHGAANIKVQNVEMKTETQTAKTTSHAEQNSAYAISNEEKIYKLQPDEDEFSNTTHNTDCWNLTSPYFASPVDWKYVDDLCQTVGHLAAINDYFQNECTFHIVKRLKRFFDGRSINSERDYNYISRSIRGLIACGEHAFREFIPFLYKLKCDLPEILWNDFSIAAIFLRDGEDIFLYEWLEYVCGGDKLQPFMVYYAEYYEKFIYHRFCERKSKTFKLNPKLGVRRLEWSTLVARMCHANTICHGDDPNKALNPKPLLPEVFPELKIPNLKLNRGGNIRFKFAGCRPIIIKAKQKDHNRSVDIVSGSGLESTSDLMSHEILIAKRRLFGPLSNEKRIIPLSTYYYLRI
ncbi:SAGA factor-like TAF6 isoform 1-T1 [Glossina fuscipes fuscipes]